MSADAKTPEPKAAESTPVPEGWPYARWLVVAAALFVVFASAGAWAVNEFSDPPQIKAAPRSHTLGDLMDEGDLPEVTLSKTSDRSGHLHGKAHNQNGKALHKLKLWIKTPKWDRIYEVKVAIEHGATGTFSVYIGESRVEVEEFKVLYQREYRPPD
jgi:hypothetical protein